MALQALVRGDGYRYTQAVATLDDAQIEQAMERHRYYRAVGVIIAGEYNALQWILSDEVHMPVTISFEVDEVNFVHHVAPTLGCSCAQYKQAMRVVIMSLFGFSLRTLQQNANYLSSFANTLELPKEFSSAQILIDLLELLPGDSVSRKQIISQLQDIPPIQGVEDSNKQRTLAVYQSYLRFNDYIEDFWRNATLREKIAFFPVYFWWKVTCILPTRPTECALTPRKCITRDEMGRYYLTMRKTKLKGTSQSVQYNIAQDYECHKYPIPEPLALEILAYIEATEDYYESDIDVLFCKTSQFQNLGITSANDKHYTYNNLAQCLQHFYDRILQEKYGLTIAENGPLCSHEITRICLGDTRHIAMISLMISGGSPSVCRQLAGHCSYDISDHYYSNIESFLDVLAYERYRPDVATPSFSFDGLPSVDRTAPIANGYCQSPLVKQGNFEHCGAAVSADGEIGACKVCKYHLAKKSAVKCKETASKDLQETILILRQTLNQLRQGYGTEEPLSCALDRFRANALRYCNASAVEKLLREEIDYD